MRERYPGLKPGRRVFLRSLRGLSDEQVEVLAAQYAPEPEPPRYVY